MAVHATPVHHSPRAGGDAFGGAGVRHPGVAAADEAASALAAASAAASRAAGSPTLDGFSSPTPARTDGGSPPLRGLALLRADLTRLASVVRGDWRGLFRLPLFDTYDRAALRTYYDAHPAPVVARAASVAFPAALLFARYKLATRTPGDRAARAAELRALLVAAGPVFIKAGQALSNRPELVGPDGVKELAKLVDRVAPFPSAQAMAVLREELGVDDLTTVFTALSAEPVAAASLGQVYRGVLTPEYGGGVVAVKVQRPAVRAEAGVDLYLMGRVASWARSRLRLRSDLAAIVDEFGARLYEELDYVNECANGIRFLELYGDMEGIKVPTMVSSLARKRVLVLEWVQGTKPGTWGADARRLVGLGINCSLTQLLSAGFYHADPHAGNLLRTDDGGELAYLDFGMMATLDLDKRTDLLRSIAHLVNREYGALADDFVRLDFLPPGTDTAPIVPLLREAFAAASTGDKTSDLSFGALADSLAGIAYATPIRIPPYYSLVVRSLTILEGIALTHDPEFKIVAAAYPFVATRFLSGESPALRDALQEVLVHPVTRRLRWSRLASLLGATTRGYGGVTPSGVGGSGGTVAAEPVAVVEEEEEDAFADDVRGPPVGGVPGTPSVGAAGAPPTGGGLSSLGRLSPSAVNRVTTFILSSRGEFLRDALALEVADAVDTAALTAASAASLASGGLLPQPVERPDPERLAATSALLSAVSAAAGSGRPGGAPGSGAGAGGAATPASRSVAAVLGAVQTRAAAGGGAEVAALARAGRVVAGELADRNVRRGWAQVGAVLRGVLPGGGGGG